MVGVERGEKSHDRNTCPKRRSRSMIELSALPPSVQAALLVGVILVQAVVLYVGYGAVERIATELFSSFKDA